MLFYFSPFFPLIFARIYPFLTILGFFEFWDFEGFWGFFGSRGLPRHFSRPRDVGAWCPWTPLPACLLIRTLEVLILTIIYLKMALLGEKPTLDRLWWPLVVPWCSLVVQSGLGHVQWGWCCLLVGLCLGFGPPSDSGGRDWARDADLYRPLSPILALW